MLLFHQTGGLPLCEELRQMFSVFPVNYSVITVFPSKYRSDYFVEKICQA